MYTANKTFQTLALTAAILSATTMASTAVTASSEVPAKVISFYLR